MKKTTIFKFILLLLAFPFLAACSDDDDEVPEAGTVQVNIQHIVGSEPLQLNDATYTSPAGDTYTVSDLKYYISNVKLIGSNGQTVYIEPESYHLISQDGKLAFELLDVPANTYNQIELSIGVDEAHNHSTDQEGDLDPSNEMVWDWDTGYKFVSLMGSYTGDTKSGFLVFHIGGDANFKTITLDLPQPIDLRKQTNPELMLQADVNEMFQGPNLIDFDVMNSGGHGAGPSMMAENYSNGFLKITEVKQ
ncbi:MbnP family protein [uncultured Pontibacter sp.]|uniref:MbnP family protein n=1 Tax=uncultured Pontibacter sp. TaxID=453356 RepID=UPI002632EFC6|nr:MbnP family protein [uncultured Pontibacter sp.]